MSAAKLIVSVVMVGMLFPLVLISVIQRVKVSQYVMSDVKGIL